MVAPRPITEILTEVLRSVPAANPPLQERVAWLRRKTILLEEIAHHGGPEAAPALDRAANARAEAARIHRVSFPKP
ncbi:hypothetical protein GCM10012275_02530 [Longimycelium tulufanense]|uniref:Uncharacterized protein n=1 Tax=Longimycelium tulufanense TaxID=907463 RepID=A0A8J3FUG0_9PSEU|nr:hypothetical protein [Longimycelium tulufanense]GGM34752.1 hypothetical protein GCM10012275_02530 [Longimycelium tulufanense]